MSEMRIAPRAENFRAPHEEAVVCLCADVVSDGRIEARPARAGIKLRIRSEQIETASDTAVNARLMRVPVLPAEGAFCPFLARDAELLRTELLLPLGIGFGDLFDGHIRRDGCGGGFRRRPRYGTGLFAAAEYSCGENSEHHRHSHLV